MHGFVTARGGFVSRLNDEERSILARLASDVAALIADEDEYTAPPPPSAPGEGDDDPIAHLDFDPGDAEDESEYLSLDPALTRVFPPMSLTDPELAGELRSLTMEDIRRGKLANLHAVVSTLTSSRGQVRVRKHEVPAWLAALTDMRLVLASRLGIEDDDDAERVLDLAVTATRHPQPVEDADRELELALASLYSGVTWWQESLLQAVAGRA
ncbi:MAG: DUF2017 family protein [bacterium]|nr:DUF2017 family protein [bacterium]